MGLTQVCTARSENQGPGRRSPQVRVLTVLIFGLFLLSVFGALAIGGLTEPQYQTTVMLDVVDAPLNQVIRMLTQQSGVNIIVAGAADISSKKVTAHVDGLPLEKVLDYIVTSAGISYRKTDDGTYLIGILSPGNAGDATPLLKDSTPAQPSASGEQTASDNMTTYQPRRKIVTEAIKLTHSAPGDILMALGAGAGLVGSPITAGYMDDKYPWKPSTPGKAIVHASQSVYIQSQSGGVQPVPPTLDRQEARRGEAQRLPNESEEAYQYSPVVSPRAGYPGQPPTMPTAPSTPTTGTTGQQGFLPPGIENILAYDIDNSLIVKGTPEAIADLKDLISRHLDIPPSQVSIKAEFIEVSANDVDRLGIDWQIDQLNTSLGTAFNPVGNVIVKTQQGNVAAELRAELTSGKGRVVNSPIISTLNNTPATITVGTYVPYFRGTTVTSSTGPPVTTYDVLQLPIQTYLFVLPRVNRDNSITLYLEPSVEDTGRTYKSPDGQEIPETRNQTLRTNRRVMNGETIVVGGFVRRQDSTNVSKVPLLGDLPIIGGVFRSTSKELAERELLIFLTPTIIPEKGGTTLGVSL